ncbi:hypothetical protein HAX54_036004 [Datura stramonium]|uniref:Uncharacterized protein n=1 Tax=Datura stramonium TaxID=4076 RepID=A0ABS8SFW4_DATST|nr:hypothetical protein [Datura stramonium]
MAGSALIPGDGGWAHFSSAPCGTRPPNCSLQKLNAAAAPQSVSNGGRGGGFCGCCIPLAFALPAAGLMNT